MGPLDRADRRLVYSGLLTYGDEAHLMLYLDGALLADLWDELDVPEPMHNLREPLIEANRRTPAQPEKDYYLRDQGTRRSSVQVVQHAEERS